MALLPAIDAVQLVAFHYLFCLACRVGSRGGGPSVRDDLTASGVALLPLPATAVAWPAPLPMVTRERHSMASSGPASRGPVWLRVAWRGFAWRGFAWRGFAWRGFGRCCGADLPLSGMTFSSGPLTHDHYNLRLGFGDVRHISRARLIPHPWRDVRGVVALSCAASWGSALR